MREVNFIITSFTYAIETQFSTGWRGARTQITFDLSMRSQHGILEYWILVSEASGILDIGFRKPPDIGYWIPKASRYWILIIQSPDGQPSTRTVLSAFGQSGDLSAALDSPNFGGQDLLCQCAVGTVGFGERRSHKTFASGGFPGRSKGFVAS